MFSGRFRDRWFVILLLALLGGIVVAERYRAYLREQNEPLDSRSDDPNGTSALRAWSESLGYRSAEDPFDFYAVPPKTDLVFFLNRPSRWPLPIGIGWPPGSPAAGSW